eukprot:scaffold7734_cov146-Isochrysis_galbana.AAC.1
MVLDLVLDLVYMGAPPQWWRRHHSVTTTPLVAIKSSLGLELPELETRCDTTMHATRPRARAPLAAIAIALVPAISSLCGARACDGPLRLTMTSNDEGR